MPAERLTSVLPTLRCEKMDGALMSYQSAPVSLGDEGRRRALAGEGVDNALLDALRESDGAHKSPTRLLALRKALVLADSHDERLKLGACQLRVMYNGSTAASERIVEARARVHQQLACSPRRFGRRAPRVKRHPAARADAGRKSQRDRARCATAQVERTTPAPPLRPARLRDRPMGKGESRAGAQAVRTRRQQNRGGVDTLRVARARRSSRDASRLTVRFTA